MIILERLALSNSAYVGSYMNGRIGKSENTGDSDSRYDKAVPSGKISIPMLLD